MRCSHRLIRSCGVLAAAATAATGLMLGSAATADTRGEPATTAASGSLYAWRGVPIGPPDRVFEGFVCQSTDYRFSSWQVVSQGPPELWMSFEDPECRQPSGFFDPGGEPETRYGVGSVQRWR